ncbi:hypothetical protein KCP78_18130 [Salmonella enterica subsp. enterica]|nr:hypothetical protein KCP78_18130 [Salmonella enterica subsp. enterica]
MPAPPVQALRSRRCRTDLSLPASKSNNSVIACRATIMHIHSPSAAAATATRADTVIASNHPHLFRYGDVFAPLKRHRAAGKGVDQHQHAVNVGMRLYSAARPGSRHYPRFTGESRRRVPAPRAPALVSRFAPELMFVALPTNNAHFLAPEASR